MELQDRGGPVNRACSHNLDTPTSEGVLTASRKKQLLAHEHCVALQTCR